MTIDTGHAAARHLQDPAHYAPPGPPPPRAMRLAKDVLAGLSIAGLLLPEAVAYAGIANLPPQAGVVALLAGLVVYALAGSSRFAIVSATSSSAAVLAATVSAVSGPALAVAAALVAATGALFLLAGAARLGGVSDFIAKPVLRGFAFGLALTIIVKQLPGVLGVTAQFSDAPRMAYDLLRQAPHWNLASVALGVGALAILSMLGRSARIPATLVVILLGIGAGHWVDWRHWGIGVVGSIDLRDVRFGLPAFRRPEWLQTTELAFALMLILYAESYGSIRTFALKHGDRISANRDLIALGSANLVSGLLQGMPVGAGYSATSANETAGAQTRLAGLCAALVVALVVTFLLGELARIPEPVLAAIVIHAVSHSINPGIFRPYWQWRRDRLLAVAALAGVLLFGVMHGLLAAIAVSLFLTLRDLSVPSVSVLGRLRESHDFVDVSAHADAKPVDGILIVRPEVPLFFANAERVLSEVRLLAASREDKPQTVMLSLEETPDVDGSAIEAILVFAAELRSRGQRLVLARLKPRALAALTRAAEDILPPQALRELSVDECVQSVLAERAMSG
ncbi:SulP family inorganic anion transporter [Trinickia caryophylli]|uniref:Sulfate permease, MFS superfamily n=1 Tax=Trinickia caryophylli TaxID=28094 RepID=A0A1X7CD96_TRICW|nr:SulP family inorganic anion transporter [Trinickia caryophylli]PMS12540.1 SulP family inorganic anion transporter [Trinickia caryophylli]TRX19746.1 SulP family inorganic anion transporter [Trinickia caryophylli]WQE12935.1 SulP family inorganic anion transporter [Trinickia caryophylli]SME94661.1 Sulfate permease, MFS superfamily [Trinickia caryophylli]GLU30662.1 membrane protein [Trinickia caryophylli]